MTPNECLLLFTALKLHFTNPKYSFIQYHGKLKHPPRFEKRKDKHFFAWLSQKPDPQGLIIANLIKNPAIFVGDLFSADAQENYFNYKKRQESLTYTFTEDVDKLIVNGLFAQAFKVIDNQHPKVLQSYLQGQTSPETMVILNNVLNFIPIWDKEMKDDPVWQSVRLPLIRYQPFVTYEIVEFKKILLDKVRGLC